MKVLLLHMNKDLREQFVRDSKVYIFLVTDGRHMPDAWIDTFTTNWVSKHNVRRFFNACNEDATTFYAYCKAKDQAHFMRMVDKVKFKAPVWTDMRILYP